MQTRRRRTNGALALVVAIALVVGVVAVAGAGSSTALPPLSESELMVKMAEENARPRPVSGEISWTNRLFGDVDMAAGLAQMPAQSPLTSSGAGRIWVSKHGVRVESQANGGDQVVVASVRKRELWIYDSAGRTARRSVWPGPPQTDAPTPSPAMSATPSMVADFLRRTAPYAVVDMAPQTTVAGRAAYVLRMTPVADDTALAFVLAAIDGETMVPLRLEVFAKGADEAVLRFGFDSVSYEAVDEALFSFTPPASADVVVDRARAEDDVAMKSKGKASHADVEKGAPLTRAQAQSLVDFKLAEAREYTARSFHSAHVFGDIGPLTAAEQTLAPSSVGGVGAQANGPTSVLLYGSGFGAIALLQTRTTPELTEALDRVPSLVVATSAGDTPVRTMMTPLGGISVWQSGGTTLVAGGLVTPADLQAFVGAVR